MAEYTIWLATDQGVRLSILSPIEFWYTRVANDIGGCALLMPDTCDDYGFAVDQQIQIYRQPAESLPMALERIYFVREIGENVADDGTKQTLVSGPDLNDLLARRTVAYRQGDNHGSINLPADDGLKKLVRNNMLSPYCVDAARDLGRYGFTVAPNEGLAPTLSRAFHWRNLLDSLKEIANFSRDADVPLYFEIDNNFCFRTWIDQSGIDRTWREGDHSGA